MSFQHRRPRFRVLCAIPAIPQNFKNPVLLSCFLVGCFLLSVFRFTARYLSPADKIAIPRLPRAAPRSCSGLRAADCFTTIVWRSSHVFGSGYAKTARVSVHCFRLAFCLLIPPSCIEIYTCMACFRLGCSFSLQDFSQAVPFLCAVGKENGMHVNGGQLLPTGRDGDGTETNWLHYSGFADGFFPSTGCFSTMVMIFICFWQR